MASDPSGLLQTLLGNVGQGYAGMNEVQESQQRSALNQQAQAMNAVQLQAAQQKQHQDDTFGSDFADYQRAPTTDKLAELAIAHPDRYEAIKQFWAIKDPEVRQSHITAIAQPLAALQNNKPDMAVQSLTAMRDAAVASGGAQAPDAVDLQKEIDAIQSGDPDSINAVKASFMMHLAAADNDGKFAESLKRVKDAYEDKYVAGAPGSTVYNQSTGVPSFSVPNRPTYRTIKTGNGTAVYQLGGDDDGDADGGSSGTSIDPVGLVQGALPGSLITSGKRSLAKQAALVAQGASPTLASYHVSGNAVDIRPIDGMSFGQARAKVARAAADQGGKLVEAINESQSGGTGPHWHFAIVPAHTATQAGARKVLSVAGPDTNFRQLTPDEAKASNLDPTIAWQIGPNNRVMAVPGQGQRRIGKAGVADVIMPIYQKVAAGTPLTPGENAAWMAYTKAPRNQRQRSAPAVVGAAPALAVGAGGRLPTTLPVKVASLQEAQRLPSGTRFLTPDGRVKVRP